MSFPWRAIGTVLVANGVLYACSSYTYPNASTLSEKLQRYPQKRSESAAYSDPYLNIVAQTDCLALLKLDNQADVPISEVRRCERLKMALISNCIRMSKQELKEVEAEPRAIKKIIKLEELSFRCLDIFRLSVESSYPLVEVVRERRELFDLAYEFLSVNEQSKQLVETVRAYTSEEIDHIVNENGARV